ncbi:MAG TPA: hypothetical protein VHQ86_05980 [Candidatus Saccharimonadia bacterium]|jgi:pimeloyl-ACP methyl ester carboxylesterase|nr:hypothetical protein [Candidatus Saccharimonadia bacterium]
MLRNLKLIFIHGINNQITNYSQGLYVKVLKATAFQLARAGANEAAIEDVLMRIVHHEVLWANLTTDLTERYLQLGYGRPNVFWNRFTRPIDPLGLQIMQYIKDKGDRQYGPMNILGDVDASMNRIFSAQDLGERPRHEEGHHAIVIGHSLGSVIAFDYLMGFRPQHQLRHDITVHNFITMGSPLPLFISAMGHPDSDLMLPPAVRKWTNILSPRDAIARSHVPFFHQIPIEEHWVHTNFGPVAAHIAYWKDDVTAQIIAQEVLIALGLMK